MISGGHLLSRYHRHGDADAFCALVRDHAGMVFATAKRVVGDAALAEDVAQETFLELARKGHDAVESVSAWLHRVAWRKACNVVRGEARRREREQAAAETFGTTTEASWNDLEPLIEEALGELPPRLRECLVEHYLEGRTQQELAGRMGVNRSTVSRQLDEGIRALRSLLRAKGIQCGAGLAAVLSTGSAQAAPSSLTASLGKLAISGMGAASPGTASIAVGTALLTMNISKITLTIAAAAALVSLPVIVFHRTNTDEKNETGGCTGEVAAVTAIISKTDFENQAKSCGTRALPPCSRVRGCAAEGRWHHPPSSGHDQGANRTKRGARIACRVLHAQAGLP